MERDFEEHLKRGVRRQRQGPCSQLSGVKKTEKRILEKEETTAEGPGENREGEDFLVRR